MGATLRDIDLKTLRLLVSVCEHRNMARAAQEAHIEPSAVSKRIAQLEADLGVPLLMRSRRGVEPTAAGLAVLEHARSVFFTIDRLANDVAAFGGGLKGSVTVCATASAIAESLLDDLASFMRLPAHHRIRVNVEEWISDDLVRRIREGAASLGVCWDNVDLTGLFSAPYREDRLAVAVPLAHPLAERTSLHFADTLDYEHVGLPPTTAVLVMLQRAAAKRGRTLSFRAIVSNFDAALRVVAANLAVSVIPEEVGASYARSLAVRIVPLADEWARRRFVVCFRDFGTLAPAAQRLVEHLVQRAAATARAQ